MNKKLLIALIIVLGIGLTFFGALYFFNEEDDEENVQDDQTQTEEKKGKPINDEEFGRYKIKEYKFTDLEKVMNDFLANGYLPYIETCTSTSETESTSNFTALSNDSLQKVLSQLKKAKTYEKDVLITYYCPEAHFFIGKVENNVKTEEVFSLNCGLRDMVIRYGDTGFAFNFEVTKENELMNFIKSLK